MNIIEEIKRLKALLDEGAITQDEFNKLKKNLLTSDLHPVSLNENASDQPQQSHKATYSKVRMIIGIILFISAGAFGVTKFGAIKEIYAKIVRKDFVKNNNKDDGYIYDGNKKIGRIVKMKIVSAVPHSGAGVIPINVPSGKMWTPLYYEFISGSAGRNGFNIYIYPESNRYGYLNDAAFEFRVSKSDFVSYKFSKQNYRSIVGQGNQGIIIVSWSPPSSFEMYFLEESVE
jgi:Short C-terminal domain